jgi:hypothetical protein
VVWLQKEEDKAAPEEDLARHSALLVFVLPCLRVCLFSFAGNSLLGQVSGNGMLGPVQLG